MPFNNTITGKLLLAWMVQNLVWEEAYFKGLNVPRLKTVQHLLPQMLMKINSCMTGFGRK